MNTIPSIFNERKISHTVVENTENFSNVKMPVTCILLCHGINQFKHIVFQNLLEKGFAEIISVERKSTVSHVEELSSKFPQVKFVVTLEENVTEGDMLNLGMSEARYNNVLVLQEEQCTQNFSFTPSLAKKLIEKNVFCVCPKLVSASYENLCVCFKPEVKKSMLVINPVPNCNDGDKTLYSTDLSGFYNLEKYIQLGGIDYTIVSEHWQKVDLFFRSWLWGEQTIVNHGFTLRYSDSVLNQDFTPDATYMRFYLKNLLPVYKNDHAYIPSKSFFAFSRRSPFGFSDSVSLFRDAKLWTEKNQYRFKTDAATLINDWKN